MALTAGQKKYITKYLANYAESEVELLASFSALSKSRYVLTIPAYNESDEFIKRFIKRFANCSVTLILVINQPESEAHAELQDNLWLSITEMATLQEAHEHLSFYKVPDCPIKILVIKRFGDGLQIPDRQGVGLARKIAADCAVQLIQRGLVSVPWIGSSDADAVLPEDYFLKFEDTEVIKKSTAEVQIPAAAIYDFTHILFVDGEIYKGTKLYEQRLNYYVAGLKFAGSPYAFHTIGSCLSFSASGYCQARGFPKKSGGEDFYLLNKLAKLGQVKQLDSVIQIQSRLSDRVPFGTGPAVSNIIGNDDRFRQYKVYNPAIFIELKSLLALFSLLDLDNSQKDFMATEDFVTPYRYLNEAGFFPLLAKWRSQYKSRQQLQKAIHDWFDAFRTMKFVHYCRDNVHTNILLEEALETAKAWG